MSKTWLPALTLLASALAQVPVENNPLGTPNLVVNGNFTDGITGWVVQGSNTVSNNMICVAVPASTSANASYLKTTNFFTEVKNDIYYLNFTAYASVDTNLWLQTQGMPLVQRCLMGDLVRTDMFLIRR